MGYDGPKLPGIGEERECITHKIVVLYTYFDNNGMYALHAQFARHDTIPRIFKTLLIFMIKTTLMK